jgi:hypothetical protein
MNRDNVALYKVLTRRSLFCISLRSNISQSISKLFILSVGDICKFNVRLVSSASFTRSSISSLVFPLVVESEHKRQDYGSSTSDDDGDFCRDVIWCVCSAEGQGSDDVAETEGDEEDSVHGDLMLS